MRDGNILRNDLTFGVSVGSLAVTLSTFVSDASDGENRSLLSV